MSRVEILNYRSTVKMCVTKTFYKSSLQSNLAFVSGSLHT